MNFDEVGVAQIETILRAEDMSLLSHRQLKSFPLQMAHCKYS